ncbi:MAG: hypothetical protein ACKO83_04215 [Roseiflexaceae bacterium]
MTDPVLVETLLAHTQTIPAQSGKRRRATRWWFFFVVAVVSFATGVAGFVDAIQKERTQLTAFALMALVVVVVVVRSYVARRIKAVAPWHPLSFVRPAADWSTTLVHTARLTRWQVWMGRSIRILDFLLWVLLALVLVGAAATIFTFSAFGLYDGLVSGIDIFDMVLLIGLVGPFMSVRSGMARWRARRDGSRKRLNSFTETLRNALGAINNFFNTSLDSTAGFIRSGVSTVSSSVSASVVSVTTTAALTATVAGVGLAAVDVAPRSIIATGRVVPLPMEVAMLAGEDGKNVGLRGEILLNCMDDIVNDTEDYSDIACQQAVHQVSSECATWDGTNMPRMCETQVFALLPEIQALVGDGDSRRDPAPPNAPQQRAPNEQRSPPDTRATTTYAIMTPTQFAATDVPTSQITAMPTQTESPVPTLTMVANTPVAAEPQRPPNMTQMPAQGGDVQGTPQVRLPNNNALGTPLDTPLPGTEGQPNNP